MNYKVMQRPMFKMGGKAASQGTGITSGLDEKVNMTDGRAKYADGRRAVERRCITSSSSGSCRHSSSNSII